MIEYREHAPAPELADIVECYWRLEGDGGGTEFVFPDGRVEVVIHLDQPIRRTMGNTQFARSAAIVGPLRSAACLTLPQRIQTVGVRFRPGAASRVLGHSIHELGERSWPLPDSLARLPETTRRTDFAAQLDDCIGSAVDTSAARSLAEEATLRIETHVPSRVAKLAAELHTTPRTLERAFRKNVGLTPKMFLRIARFRRALAHIDDFQVSSNWAEFALGAGYSDQAHFIREFRALTGTTPLAYVASKGELTRA